MNLYNEGDWLKIIDINSNKCIKAGKVVDIKKQGLFSFDHRFFFVEKGTEKYKVLNNDEHLVIDESVPKNYSIRPYMSIRKITKDIYREYDINELDKEVEELVTAMNTIDGLYTKGSCCGHGYTELWVTFIVEDKYSLEILKKCMNKYKDDFKRLIVVTTNKNKERRLWRLKTKELGEKAYTVAKLLAQRIRLITNK